jgi:DNA (cytosine-5)-methyltransferase 1
VNQQPIILDLFCGQGGAARGYINAGYDVIGVDIEPSVGRYYPGRFIAGDWRVVADILRALGLNIVFVHASPPCQLYSITNAARKHDYPDLVAPVRDYLLDWGVPFVLENVERAPLRKDAVLCGTHFGLEADDPATGLTLYLKRHRIFETHGFKLPTPGPCRCLEFKRAGRVVGGVYGGGRTNLDEARNVRHGGYTPKDKAVRARLMGLEVDDMTLKGLNEAIPPAYAEWVGINLRLTQYRRQLAAS